MIRRPLMLLLALVAGTTRAGGHFDVDDAGTLDPGQCQYETWAGRFGSEPVGAFHLGAACRVGPVELGLNLDRYSAPDGRSTVLGPQLKWTFVGQGADARFAAAVSTGASFDLTHGGRAGGQLVIPVSWRAIDPLWVHANLGADWATGTGARTGRVGLAGEWALNERVSLIAERNKAFGLRVSRVGTRLSLTPLVSIDLSVARTGREGPRCFVVGLNHEFTR
jgi:hypothetical protein